MILNPVIPTNQNSDLHTQITFFASSKLETQFTKLSGNKKSNAQGFIFLFTTRTLLYPVNPVILTKKGF